MLVIGSSGFLGSTLVSKLGADAADRKQIDLAKSQSSSIDELLGRGYGYIAISAAVTDIEFCYKNPTESRQINVEEVVVSEPRPNYKTLNCEKLEKALGFQFTEVAEGLYDFQELLKPQ